MWMASLVSTLIWSQTATESRPQFEQKIVVAADKFNDPALARFTLPDQEYIVKSKLKMKLKECQVEVYHIQFPSFIKSLHPENDIVYGEYFKPTTVTSKPAVLVLDILDGAGLVSRGEAVWLAAHGIPALTLSMPYYGNRRPRGEKVRFLSLNLNQTLDNVRQAVLDARRGIAWLAEQTEVDAKHLGIVGTSLGSFLGAMCAAAEPRVSFACLLLGGGDLVESYYDHPQAAIILQALRLIGITKPTLKRQMAMVDPITYANQIKQKRILYIGASNDEIVPPKALKSLWMATGSQKIIWFNTTHVGASAYAFQAMNEILNHIKHQER